jgi:hypothetical protein
MSDNSNTWKVEGDAFALDSSREQLLHIQHLAPSSPNQSNASLESSDTVIHLHSQGTAHNNTKELLTAPTPTPPSAIEIKLPSKTVESISVEECNKDGGPLDNPPRKRARLSLCQRIFLHWLTAYRILIATTILANLGVYAAQIATGPSANAALTATAANLLAAVVIRNEEVVNSSYFFLTKIQSTLPFTIRKIIGDFHHYGGMHIGCAISAALWYCLFVALKTAQVQDSPLTPSLSTHLATAWIFLLFIVLVCATAIPCFRVRFHNTFERTHRFGGWTALLVLWIHTGISTLTSSDVPLWSQPALYLLTTTTTLIILPWLRIRRVPITTELISARDLKLTFAYTNMPYTSTIRLSTHPLTEWHAFATIPVSKSTANILVSRAGDWTASLLANPPSHIWIRRPPTTNFLALAPTFNSLLLVATGAGVGPMLSLLASPAMASMQAAGKPVRVLWCVYEPHAPRWTFVMDAIRTVDAQPVIFDSRQGRPDVAFEAGECMVREGLEAVLVVSNPTVTREVVDEVRARGGAGYGAVFDS